MTPASIAAIAYGLLALVGGAIGYAQARSKASLISGTLSGLLLIAGGLWQQQNRSAGLALSLAVTIALLIVFGNRWAKTRKFMPAGLMIVAGAIALVVLLWALLSGNT